MKSTLWSFAVCSVLVLFAFAEQVGAQSRLKLDKAAEAYVAQLRAAAHASPYDPSVMYRIAIQPEFDKVVLQAAKDGDESLVVEMLSSVYSSDGKGNDAVGTALMWAAKSSHIDAARALLARPQNVNAEDVDGCTALHFAVSEYQTEMARLLVNKKADVNAKTTRGDTPLMSAASNKATDTTLLLLQHGAKVNDVNNEGKTALMQAARAGRLKQVQLLLAKGANARLKDKKGRAALNVAHIAFYREFTGELLPDRDDAARKGAEADLQEIKRLLARAQGVAVPPDEVDKAANSRKL